MGSYVLYISLWLEIVGTITAVDTFLGVILGISTAQYNKTSK